MPGRGWTRNDRGSGSLGTVALIALIAVLCYVFWGDIKPHLPFVHKPTATDYCNTFETEGTRLHDEWLREHKANGGDPIKDMGLVLGSPEDMAVFLDKLAKNSPDEIRPDVKTLAGGYRKLADNFTGNGTDVMGSAFNGLMLSMMYMQPEQRVDQYTQQHCGAIAQTNPTS